MPNHQLARTVNDSLEKWRTVPGYPGYEVSNQARVRSYKKQRGPSPGGGANWTIEKTPQRYLTLVPTGRKDRAGHPKGYRQLRLSHNGRAQHFALHQLVALAWCGPCPEGMEVCHNDGIAANNRPSNLRYDIPEGNREDKRRLSRRRAAELRKEYATGISLDELCEQHSLSAEYMKCILRGSQFADASGRLVKTFRKLGESNIIRMRKMRTAGLRLSTLSEFYGVTESAVSRIVRGISYRKIGGPITIGLVCKRAETESA